MMKKSYHLSLFVLFLWGGISHPVFAHPFDQLQNDSGSKIKIFDKTIEFTVKIPVHSYINLWVTSREEYDAYLQSFTSPIEREKILSYFKKNYYIFDDKMKLTLTVSKMYFEYPEFGSVKEPEAIIIAGQFTHKEYLNKIYIFNDLFIESDKDHVGRAEIEFSGSLFEFTFAKKKFFHIVLDKYRPKEK